MPQRPLSVMLISYLFIVAGAVGIAYHATDLGEFGYEAMWVLLVRLLAIIGGVFTLLGRNWARRLLLAWMAYHVVLSAFHSLPEFLLHGLLLAVVAYALFRPGAAAFFRGEIAEAA